MISDQQVSEIARELCDKYSWIGGALVSNEGLRELILDDEGLRKLILELPYLSINNPEDLDGCVLDKIRNEWRRLLILEIAKELCDKHSGISPKEVSDNDQLIYLISELSIFDPKDLDDCTLEEIRNAWAEKIENRER